MFFIFDSKNPKILLIFIVIILLGITLEYFNILSTQKTVAIAMLIFIAIYAYKHFK